MPSSAPIRTPNYLAPIPGQRRFDAQTLSMIVALTSEVTVLRARLDTCERLLAHAGVVSSDAIENFNPDAAAQAERDQLRQQSMNKIFRSMLEASDADLALSDGGAEEESRYARND